MTDDHLIILQRLYKFLCVYLLEFHTFPKKNSLSDQPTVYFSIPLGYLILWYHRFFWLIKLSLWILPEMIFVFQTVKRGSWLFCYLKIHRYELLSCFVYCLDQDVCSLSLTITFIFVTVIRPTSTKLAKYNLYPVVTWNLRHLYFGEMTKISFSTKVYFPIILGGLQN